MNSTVITKKFPHFDFSIPEIERYLRVKNASCEVSKLINSVIEETLPVLTYSVTYAVLPLKIKGDISDLSLVQFSSKDLAKKLHGCSLAVVFAATLGLGIDKLINRYSSLSPSRALAIEALGNERIEGLCNLFQKGIAEEFNAPLTARFSPGYGDLDISFQKEIFALLDCPRRIGLSLSDSMIMSPSKSVSAIVGLCKK
jgi:hypothetical protein